MNHQASEDEHETPSIKKLVPKPVAAPATKKEESFYEEFYSDEEKPIANKIQSQTNRQDTLSISIVYQKNCLFKVSCLFVCDSVISDDDQDEEDEQQLQHLCEGRHKKQE